MTHSHGLARAVLFNVARVMACAFFFAVFFLCHACDLVTVSWHRSSTNYPLRGARPTVENNSELRRGKEPPKKMNATPTHGETLPPAGSFKKKKTPDFQDRMSKMSRHLLRNSCLQQLLDQKLQGTEVSTICFAIRSGPGPRFPPFPEALGSPQTASRFVLDRVRDFLLFRRHWFAIRSGPVGALRRGTAARGHCLADTKGVCHRRVTRRPCMMPTRIKRLDDCGRYHFWPRPLLARSFYHFWPSRLLAQTTFGPDRFLAVSGLCGGGAPKGGRPKISRFSLSRHNFLSFFLSWGSFRGILVVFEAPGPEMCTFGVLENLEHTPHRHTTPHTPHTHNHTQPHTTTHNHTTQRFGPKTV